MEEREYSRKRPYDDVDGKGKLVDIPTQEIISSPQAKVVCCGRRVKRVWKREAVQRVVNAEAGSEKEEMCGKGKLVDIPTMADKKPIVGMRLELRDDEYIWCPVRVQSVHNDNNNNNNDGETNNTHVTVRYDGWGESFDERIPWKSERLAPIYTFTKSVKCFFDVLPKQKKKALSKIPPNARREHTTNLWPCKVQLRMPHPFVQGEGQQLEESCLYAQEFLKQYKTVFVQPYGIDLLPRNVRLEFDKDNGGWLQAYRMRMWKDDFNELGVLPDNFAEAFQMALNDTETPGVLRTNNVMEKGSLLKANFRIHSRQGAQIRDGSLHFVSELPHWLTENVHEAEEQNMVPPAVVRIRQPTPPIQETKQVDSKSPEEHHQPPEYVPPPLLPVPIQITDMIYPGCGIRKCKNSNQYVASISLGANHVFLGKFPTQTQAYQATRLAAGENINMETDLRKARLADLQALPLEAIIEATEKQRNPKNKNSFSIHDWSLQNIRRAAYLESINQSETGSEAASVPNVASTRQMNTVDNTGQNARNKRKGVPRKVDLDSHTYCL